MVYVSYSHRILIDPPFVKWISQNRENKSIIISKMLRINQNSKEHKKENIVILKEEFNKLCEDGIIKDQDTIRGGMCPVDFDRELLTKITDSVGVEIEADDDFVRLILGVLMTSRKPFQVVILTTEEGKKKYEKYNTFLEKIPNLSIKCEEESLIIINDLFKSYVCEKDKTR